METEPRASDASHAPADGPNAAAPPDALIPTVSAEPETSLQPPPARIDGAPQGYAAGVERLAPPEGAARQGISTSGGPQPSGMFLFIVTFVSFVSDISTKLWAEQRLTLGGTVVVLPDHLQFVLAKNRGGAWGLLQKYDENVRRPFFLLVSLAAIVFIITLYRRLQPTQRALRWGLPLVLGGALGNVFDRVRYGHVIDFIDYRGDWIKKSYEFLDKFAPGQMITDHWPTFNVADVAICVGVGLMAVDMFTARRTRTRVGFTPSIVNLPPVVVTTIPAETSPVAPSEAEAADPKTEEIPLPEEHAEPKP